MKFKHILLICTALVVLPSCTRVPDEPQEVNTQDVAPEEIVAEPAPTPTPEAEETPVPEAFDMLDGGKNGNIYRDKKTGCQWVVLFWGSDPMPPMERKDANHQQICGPMPSFAAEPPAEDAASNATDTEATPPNGMPPKS